MRAAACAASTARSTAGSEGRRVALPGARRGTAAPASPSPSSTSASTTSGNGT
ncbi:hypothetical protein ACFQ60_29365 [Streptomyces zhihengii]